VSGRRFADDLVGHLAWPLVVLVGVFVFRQVLREKLRDMTEADVASGNLHFAFRFRAQSKAKSELGKVGADLSQAYQRHADTVTEQWTVPSIQKVAMPDTTKETNMVPEVQTVSDEDSRQWASIGDYLNRSPHSAIHLAGLRIDATLMDLAGPNAPALGMLVRPKYLAEQGVISQELADASIRLLRIRNAVDGSPKFMLTQEIAQDFVAKSRELVAALIQQTQQTT
jgi:hypothetical protein